MLTYKYKLYPNQKQQKLLWLHANKLNWLYNYFLNLKIESYKKDKTIYNLTQLDAMLPLLCKTDNILNEIHSQVRQQVTKRVIKSFVFFFNFNNKFPKFRSCRNFFGICYPQNGYSIMSNVLHTKVYGDIKFKKHRDYKGNIKQIYITTKNNKWYLCIITDHIHKNINYDFRTNVGPMCGVDVGITNLVATSDDKIIKNESGSKYYDKQINKLKSRRDKLKENNKNKLSNKAKYLNKVIRRLYSAKNNKVNDFQHKVSKHLSRNYNTIFIENLSLVQLYNKGITGLNREMHNARIATFLNMLKYKVNHVFEVDPKYTSQTCNKCGNVQKTPLYKRTYKCLCGYIEDRDINAAKNINCLGQALMFSTSSTSISLKEALCFNRE